MVDWMKKPFHEKKFLVYLGTPGIGKTYMAAAMIEWIVENFNTFRYYKIQDLHSILRQSFDGIGDYHKILELAIDDELVIIDDIGSDKISEWKEEILFDIIDERYNSMRPTIITSNMLRKDWEKTYQDRIISRLFDKSNTIIEINDKTKDKRRN